MFMRDLLTEKAKDIYRCKGMLSVHVSGFVCVCVCGCVSLCVIVCEVC